jgi:integrase
VPLTTIAPRRTWAHVDFQSGWLRLEPGETKNAEGRQFPLTPALRAVLVRQRARTLVVEKATRTIIPWLIGRAARSSPSAAPG